MLVSGVRSSCEIVPTTSRRILSSSRRRGRRRTLLLERLEQRPLGLLDRPDVLDVLDDVRRCAVPRHARSHT